MRLYKYTLLKQDGTKEDLGISKKKSFADFYKILDCQLIEIIPADYYKGLDWGRCNCYGDEEARFDSGNTRNKHFKVLKDTIYNEDFDIVGDIIKEEVSK